MRRINIGNFAILSAMGRLSESDIQSKNPDRRFGVCRKCGRTFKTASGLSVHTKEYHDAYEARQRAAS